MKLKSLSRKSKSRKPIFLKSLSLLVLSFNIFADYSFASTLNNDKKERTSKVANVVARGNQGKVPLEQLAEKAEILKSVTSSKPPNLAKYIDYQTNNEDNSDITVTGIDLIYDANNPEQDWNKQIKDKDIKSLTLIGETITIRSGLNLPGTNLKIYARTLNFEDPDHQNLSYISTDNKGEGGGILTLSIGGLYENQNKLLLNSSDSSDRFDGLYPELNFEYSSLWLKEEVIQKKIEMLQEVYLGGNTKLAQQIAEDYLTERQKIKTVAAQLNEQLKDEESLHGENRSLKDSSELQIYDHKIIDYYFQLLNNLDYFGNRPGWVPLLSLETIQEAYKKEINSSVDLLLLSYALEKRWRHIEQRENSLERLNELYEQRISNNQGRVRELKKNISELDRRRELIDQDTKYYLSELKEKEAEIEQKFAKNEAEKKFWKDMFNAMSLAATTLSFGGKGGAAAAGAASFYSFLGNQLEDTPSINSGATAQVLENLSQQNEINEARDTLAKLSLDNVANFEEFIGELESLSDVISQGTRQQIQNQLKQGLDSETKAKLDRIKQSDPEFNDLFDGLIKLITRKQIFYNETLESKQLVDNYINEIAADRLSKEEINQSRRDENNQIDEPTRRALRGTTERAEQRLIRYKYYLIKAYEHRLLKPFPSDNYNVKRLFNKLASNFSIEKTGDNSITIESGLFKDLKKLYENDLVALNAQIIETFVNERTASLNKTRKLKLTNDEINQLNSKGVVTIDLNQHIFLESDRGAKLIKIKVDPQKTKISKSPESSDGDVEVTFERSNFSIVRWRDKDYYFEYGGKNTVVSPVIGGFSWSYSSSESSFTPISISDNGLIDNTSNSKRVHTLPGARTTLKIYKDNTGNSAPVNIENLVLDVHLEASSKR